MIYKKYSYIKKIFKKLIIQIKINYSKVYDTNINVSF